jgi:hypothetical protein
MSKRVAADSGCGCAAASSVRRNACYHLALVVLVSVVVSASAQTQEDPCDVGLLSLARGPQGYAVRQDRCEGIYARPVGGTALMLASLTESFEDYDLKSGDDLVVEWTAPSTGSVRLRAQGVKRDLYYRMDAADSAAAPAYRWHSDVLAAQHIPRSDIGVLGWTRHSVGGVDRDVYLPLRVRQHDPPGPAGVYDLVLFPVVELKEVYVSLAAVGPDGRPTRFIKHGEPLSYGYYPPERPVSVRLRNLGAAGVYYVEIGATLLSGGSATLTQWIYRSNGPPPR